MKTLSIALVFLTSAFLLVNCSSTLSVTTEYDKAVDFSQYKTFAINKTLDKEKQSISELNQERIYSAVRAEMTKKGLTENSSAPDVIVHTATVFKDKQSVTASTNYYGYGGYYRPYAWGGTMGVSGYTTYNVQDYKDGSLIIDVVDAKTQKLVWEGVGNKEIDGPIKDPDKKIPMAVAQIMTSFPPGKTK